MRLVQPALQTAMLSVADRAPRAGLRTAVLIMRNPDDYTRLRAVITCA